ncbi:MAG: SulP family inorganic anion transporter [Verrucomicrobia bacterium]|nr:SulP family inorganic anion transporter [Verrucomicrobiota bacterium]
MNTGPRYYLENLRQDIPASIGVFLVALPLCLGIALASGAPLFSGMIAGMVGGLVVAWASGSQLSVSGPAAGLTVIVFSAIETLGGFNAFLMSVVLAGVLQVILGYARAGTIGAFFPSAVIKGMLSAIGLILIMKQIPHATGFDTSMEGDESYMGDTAGVTFQILTNAIRGISWGATLVTLISLCLLFAWEAPFIRRHAILRMVPAPLLAVIWGVLFNAAAARYFPALVIEPKHLVSLPPLSSPLEFLSQFHLPDFKSLGNPLVYKTAVILAVVASLETLLSIEAVDKLDPHKRIAPTNRELKAQGLGNMLSGLIGGLPLTAVIVRSSANINFGGQTKISSFLHGVLLLLAVLFLGAQLNTIPLACLAAILLQTGYKLAKPSLFREQFAKGWNQFLPFIITIVAILVEDLLFGIAIGMAIGLLFVLRTNFHRSISLTLHEGSYLLRLNKDVSFLNKAYLRSLLASIGKNSHVTIDGKRATFIDQDILETLSDFVIDSKSRGLRIIVEGVSLPEPTSGSAH